MAPPPTKTPKLTASHSAQTQLVSAGRDPKWTRGLVNTPVMRASTITFDTYADLRAGVKTALDTNTPFYGRMGTPSQWALRDTLTELEHGDGTHLFPSGVAAIAHTLLALLDSGDHILIPDSVYEPVRGIAVKMLKRFNISFDYYDPMSVADAAARINSNTRLIFAETPGSLTFEVQDIPALAKLAGEKGAFLVVDNTWATPLYLNPLDLGADVSIHAGTKYLCGHSDVMVGTATAKGRAWDLLSRASFTAGQTISADDAFLTLRGIRTLDVRLRQHGAQALHIAKWLEAHPAVARVLHPALKSCPGHDIWQRDFKGSTGLFSVILKGGTEPDCAAMVDHLEHFKMGFSWGGYESLILPADPTSIRTATKWQAEGPLLRVHIGLENIDDLMADLDAGLARYTAAISA